MLVEQEVDTVESDTQLHVVKKHVCATLTPHSAYSPLPSDPPLVTAIHILHAIKNGLYIS
jgi:hypothetical protein